MKKIVLVLTTAFAILMAYAQDTLVSLNALPVPDTGFYNGNDQKGFFADTVAGVSVKFYNSYDPTWDSWQGWAYSTWTDDTTQGYENQWSAYPGYMIDSTFALAYIGIDWNNNYQNIPAGIKFSSPVKLLSVYVANSTYTALAIINGNSFARAFADGDYLRLIITGLRNGQPTDTIIHYLADYRDGLSYVQKDWAYIDLTPLGVVDSLSFNLQSTDTGDFGMNTPGYFAMDVLRFTPMSQTTDVPRLLSQKTIIYPNPASTYITVPQNIIKTTIYNLQGKKIGTWTNHTIPVANLQTGIYIARLWDGKQWLAQKIIIKH